MRRDPKNASKAKKAASAEKAKARAVKEQAKLKRWNREGIVLVDGQKMIGEMPITKFSRFVKDLALAATGQGRANKTVGTLRKDFKDAGGDLWALGIIAQLLKKDSAVREHRIRHFIMYCLQMEACPQPDLFSGLNDGMPTLTSARELGKLCGKDGGDLKSNPFGQLSDAFAEGYKLGQAELAKGIKPTKKDDEKPKPETAKSAALALVPPVTLQ